MDARVWVLDDVEPSVRAQALVALRGRSPDDPEARAARSASLERGCVADVLDGLAAHRDRAALWEPKYAAPYPRLLALSEMGAPGPDPRIHATLEACLDTFREPDGGFGHRKGSHLCVTGNLVRAAVAFGRLDDPRVARAIEWLGSAQRPPGGWECLPRDPAGGAPASREPPPPVAGPPAPRPAPGT